MDTLVQIGGLVGAVIGLIGIASAIVVYLRTSIDKGTIATLEKNGDALRDRVQLLEASDTAKTAQIEALQRENKILASVPSAAEAIKELDQKLTDHDTRTMRILEARP